MVCLQALGEDSIVAAAGAQGNFELNAMRPVIFNNVLHSARILGDACEKLRRYSIEHTQLDQDEDGLEACIGSALSPTKVRSRRCRSRCSPDRSGSQIVGVMTLDTPGRS